MANVIDGTFSIAQVLRLTKTYYGSRFDYIIRDKIRGHVQVRKKITLHPDRLDEPTVKYLIRSTSTPQYYPYIKTPKRGQYRGRRLVSGIKHPYDIVLEMDVLDIHTTSWKMRLGSLKKWDYKPPQRSIRQIYKETRAQWTPTRINRRRNNRNLYLDVGDYNARHKGLNGDFYFKCSPTYKHFGHLFGRNYYGEGTHGIIFFPKHLLALVTMLIGRGILSRR